MEDKKFVKSLVNENNDKKIINVHFCENIGLCNEIEAVKELRKKYKIIAEAVGISIYYLLNNIF